MAGIHLLLIEDDEEDAMLVVRLLRRGGIDVTYERAETEEAAAAALRERPPDVIISDYNLPAFGVEDALRLLRETGRDVPFILVSGQIGEETAAAMMKAGVDDFVLKDRPSRLVPAVQRELREAEDRRQRRQAEEALRESEQRFRLLAEHARDIIFRYRPYPTGSVEYLSPAVTAITGYRPEELQTSPEALFSLIDPADRPRLEASWRSQNPDPLVVRWRCRDGRVASIEQRAVGIVDDGGRLVAVEGILRDVTERVVAEEERERLEHQLRQAERLDSLGQLAGGIAHDFNNLLGVIIGHADLLAVDMSADDARRPGLDSIRQAAERAASLTRQLLIFSRLEPSQPETLDLNDVVAETERLLRRTIGEDIEFTTLLDSAVQPVTIDRSKLEQVILNLVVNARAAMREGGRLTIKTTNVGAGRVCLSVTDTGVGMEPAVARRAFEPFFTTKGPGQGTGLGLSTCYGIVKEAGGEITLSSEPGKGTVICVYLPVAANVTTALTRRISEAPNAAGERVLLVEDEPALREITRRILARSGYEVIEAASPADAIDVYAGGNAEIDVVLSDVVMPGMSGVQLVQHLRRLSPGLPVLLMSGYTAGESQEDDLPVIRKPFDAPGLLRRLRDVLGDSG